MWLLMNLQFHEIRMSVMLARLPIQDVTLHEADTVGSGECFHQMKISGM
jgi:hypothetical protein